MTRTLGRIGSPQGPPLVSTEVRIVALDLVVQWRRCGRTADYLADYLADAFDDADSARSVLATAINEIVENAAKFTGDKRRTVTVSARHHGDTVEIVATNHAEARHVRALETFFQDLEREGAGPLFVRRIESAERGGVGLLILARDYGATLGAELGPPDGDGLVPVTIHAALPAEEVQPR